MCKSLYIFIMLCGVFFLVSCNTKNIKVEENLPKTSRTINIQCSPHNGQEYLQLHKIEEKDSLKRIALYHEKIEAMKAVTYAPYYFHRPENISSKGDSIYWEVVIEGLDIIPVLLEHLDDTTTSAASVFYAGGQYTIADLCSNVMTELYCRGCGANTDSLMMENDADYREERSVFNYHRYLRSSIKHRKEIKAFVTDWYYKNEFVFEPKQMWVRGGDSIPAPICGCYRYKKVN